MNFEEFKTFIDKIEVPAQRLGVFNISLSNKGRNYNFNCLKQTASFNDNLMGFSLNHYKYYDFLPSNKKSKFYDGEDVCIDIWRNEFIEANKINLTKIIIKTKNWTGVLTIKK